MNINNWWNIITIIINIIKSWISWLCRQISILVGPLGSIQGQHRANERLGWSAMCKYPWKNVTYEVVNYLTSSALHVLFIFLGWFVRWEVGGRTVRICWKQHGAFLCSSHQAFSSICFVIDHVVHLYSSTDTSTTSKKSRFILSDWSGIHMIDNLVKKVPWLHSVYVDITFTKWEVAADVCELVYQFSWLVT